MLKIEIKTIATKPAYLVGNMLVNGKYFCDTLENRGKAIEAGEYAVELRCCEKSKRNMPFIKELESVRIGNGNVIRANGNILLGQNKQVGRVVNSTKFLSELIRLIEREDSVVLAVER